MSFLEEGHLVGRYRVEAFLAEGGMGRVYCAFDTLLGRRVALKVLAAPGPPGGAAIARLLREARAAAALAHPNICAVFDVGDSEREPFIAMELVRGTSLRRRLAEGEVALALRLRWLHELADALAAAHRAHLIHRDVKPDNVMVASDGRVRLLDFGIAKWDDRAEPPRLPSVGASGATGEGHVVGTQGYMAPEQAAGGAVDARTDQYAWGVLAYEVLAGRHPGAAIEPGGAGPRMLSALVPALPFGVAAVVAKALAYAPADRFADMDEIVAALGPIVPARSGADGQVGDGAPTPATVTEPPTTEPTGERTLDRVADRPGDRVGDRAADPAVDPVPAPTIGRGAARRRSRALAAAGALAAALVGGMALWAMRTRRDPGRDPASAAPLQLAVSNVRRVTFGDGCEEFPSFLPDGRALVYDGSDGAGHQVLFRLDLVSGAAPRAIVRQDDLGRDSAPTVSPDGQRVAFLHVGAARSGAQVAWLDGRQPPRTIGAATMFPRWSSDGRGVWVRKDGAVGLRDVDTGALLRAIALPGGGRALWVLGGVDGTAIVQLNHGAAATPSGLAAVGADGALRWTRADELEPGIAGTPDGRHVITARQALPGQSQLVAIPLDGAAPVSLAGTGVVVRNGLDLSADGRQLAWSTCRSVPRVARIDAEGRGVPTLTREAEDAIALAAIPGRAALAVVSGRTGRPRLWEMDPAGARAPRAIDTGEVSPRELAVSRDGAWIALSLPGAGIGIVALRASGSGGALRMLTRDGGDASPSFRARGDAVLFTRGGPGGKPQLWSVAIAGGAPTVVAAGVAIAGADASPVDDAIAYAPVGGAPMLADARGEGARPLSPSLGPGAYRAVRWSLDGRFVLVQRGTGELIDVERATGALVRRFAAEPGEVLYAPTYAVDGPVVVRVRWQGNLYVADAALGGGPRRGSAAP